MSPGGHLVTTVLAACGVAATTGSLPLTAGVAVGGFLIDVDHLADYLVVERRRDLRPSAFLRYYLEGHARRVVLILHSYELFALLALMAWWHASPALSGYLMGALMHLVLDIIFNGKLTPRSIWAFYSFGYRLAHHFDADALFGRELRDVPTSSWGAFFVGARSGPRTRGARGPEDRRVLRSG
ncbi:MAG TPA: hypothetical protein VET45_17765 [Candidatus Binatia bacterium]|nr:hypothetical protein [Candidatus Binatia bacterium]